MGCCGAYFEDFFHAHWCVIGPGLREIPRHATALVHTSICSPDGFVVSTAFDNITFCFSLRRYPYLNRAFSGGRTDGPMTPESTTVDNQHDDESTGTPGAGRGPDVRDEDVADIYRTAEFLSFRQRYIDSLGPPRNYEKMRRSVPSDRRTGLSLAYDPSYLQKRMKNNEAAKKSRDAKRQNFIENQICVMYLTKKIRDLNEMKRRLVLSR